MTTQFFKTPGGRMSSTLLVQSDRQRQEFVVALHEFFGVAGPTVGVAVSYALSSPVVTPRALTPSGGRSSGVASARAFGIQITPVHARIVGAANVRALVGPIVARGGTIAGLSLSVAPARFVVSSSGRIHTQTILSPFGFAHLVLPAPSERTLVVLPEVRVLAIN